MKKRIILTSVLSALAVTLGCDKEPTASQQLDRISNQTQQAAQSVNEYSYAQKDEFMQRMRIQLEALEQDLNKLAAKVENSSAAVKSQAKPKLDALREQAAQLRRRLEDIKHANEPTWDSVKAGANKAYDGLKDQFQKARQWLSDKIAP
jgi:hypothetical protein